MMMLGSNLKTINKSNYRCCKTGITMREHLKILVAVEQSKGNLGTLRQLTKAKMHLMSYILIHCI